MTMPHLMNCSHSEDGWCLACVKKLHTECETFRLLAVDLRRHTSCKNYHHKPSEYHEYTEPCPVENRIDAILKEAQ